MKKVIKRLLAMIITASVVLSSGLALSSNDSLAYNEGVETFVNSLYSDCLGRTADPSGFDDWCAKLSSGQVTGKQAAYGFFFSPEFLGSYNKYSDTNSLINVFYKVFLNRNADTQGMAYWNTQIDFYMNFSDAVSILFTGFSDSAEFASKCASCGITAGVHIDPPVILGEYPSTVTRTRSVLTQDDIINMIWDDTSYYDYDRNSGFSQPAESVEALDSFWNSLGFETRYVDFGNGVTRKCYAYFFDPAEHYNQLNEFRAQNGRGPLVVRYDKTEVARTRAVESCYNMNPGHIRPNGQSCFSADSEMRGENCTGLLAYQGFNDGHGNICYGAVAAWALTTDGHRENMLADYSGVAFASCAVVFVNDDGLTVETQGTWSEDERVVRIGRNSVQDFF